MPPNTGGGGGALSLKNLKQTSSDTPPNCIPISKTPTKKARPVPAKIQRPRGNDANTSLLSTSFSSFLEKWPILTCDYYQIDALHLASRLLGKHLRRDDVLQITEVEAYRPNDSACHGRFGITPRTALVFGPGGNAYVNIVADKDGVVAAAVLVRSCAPVYGLETIQKRRGMVTEKPVLLAGPGKVWSSTRNFNRVV